MLVTMNDREDIFMSRNEIGKFFIIFGKEFRHCDIEAFRTVMFVAVAHFFGLRDPKESADCLGTSFRQLRAHPGGFSLCQLGRMPVRFMVIQAVSDISDLFRKKAEQPVPVRESR